MGYETRLYIINKYDDKGFCEVIGMFDLCKMDYRGVFNNSISNFPYFEGYIFDGSDNKITEDKYGDMLRIIDIEEIIELLEKEDKSYRRIQPAINFIKSFTNKDIWPNVKVLTFGH